MRLAPLLAGLLLAACAARVDPDRPPPARTAPTLSAVEDSTPAPPEPTPGIDPRTSPLAAGLPAWVVAETPLRAQPLRKSAVLRPLAADTAVRVLGNLDNAEGRWLSVRVDDVLGWLPAQEVRY